TPLEYTAMPSARPKPLAHVRVLDLSRLLPGPLATLHLADLGAEVTRIVAPGEHEHPGATTFEALHLMLTRHKRTVALDLRAPAPSSRSPPSMRRAMPRRAAATSSPAAFPAMVTTARATAVTSPWARSKPSSGSASATPSAALISSPSVSITQAARATSSRR